MNASERGFTVPELLVAISIASILAVALLTLVVNRFIELRRVNARGDMLVEARNTLDTLSNDLRIAAGVEDEERWTDAYEATSAPGGSWQSDASELVLAVPAYDSDGDVLFDQPSLYITNKNNQIYFVDSASSTLYRRTLADPVAGNAAETTCPEGTSGCNADTELADNVSSLTFSYFDGEGAAASSPEQARSVGIDLTISKEIFGELEEVTRSIQVVVRNNN